MSKNKINVTIAAKATVQPCGSQVKPREIHPTAGAFFLIFGCESVELSLTNPESKPYKRPTHGNTQSVNM
jgi:hypothetical protein